MEVKGPQSGYNIYFEQLIWLLQKTQTLKKTVQLEKKIKKHFF